MTAPRPIRSIDGNALLKAFPPGAFYSSTWELIKGTIEAAPTLTQPEPVEGVDCVTVEDVVEGVKFRIGDGVIRVQKLGVGWSMLREDDIELICLPDAMVADLLNGAIRRGETIHWPEGHPRNPKPKEPTLLEAAQRLCDQLPGHGFGTHVHEAWADLEKAIERERKEGE